MAGQKALVLGGTGLIGSHIVVSLLKRGCSVRVLSRRNPPAPALRGFSVDFVPGCLEDTDSIRDALDGVDLLFHAAAPYPSRHFGMDETVRRALADMERLISVCREATPKALLAYAIRRSQKAAIEQAEMVAHVARSQPERLRDLHGRVRDPSLLPLAEEGRLNASLHPSLAECRDLPGLKRIIYTSSITTIGRPRGTEPGRPFERLARESDRYDLVPDPSPYFLCKRLLEASVVRAANEGLPAVILNPTLVVDARDAHLTTGRALLPVARGRMPFYLRGRVDVVPAVDVGEGHVLAALRGRTGQRYILGNECVALRDFFGMIAVEAGVRRPRIPIPHIVAEQISLATEVVALLARSSWAAFPAHGLRMLRFAQPVDSSLAVKELGVVQTPVREAIRRAIEWYRREGIL